MVLHKCIKETELALYNQRIVALEKKIDEIHSAVVGNDDKPGLKGRVGNIETSLDNTKTATKVFAAIFTALLAFLAFFKS